MAAAVPLEMLEPGGRYFELLASLTARLASTAKLDEVVDTVIAEIVHLGFGAVGRTAKDTAMSELERWLEDIELVGIDRALHHVLAQPIGARDEDHIREAGLSINGEPDA